MRSTSHNLTVTEATFGTLLSPTMAQSSPSAGFGMAAPPPGQTPPPISSVLPLATAAFFAGLSVVRHVSQLFKGVFFYFLSPFLVIIPIVAYLLSPIIISSKVLLDLFVLLPYRATVYTSEAVHPLYSFLGVACISGAIIGLGARQIVMFVGSGLLGEIRGAQRSGSPTRARPVKRPTTPASARGKRRITLRMED